MSAAKNVLARVSPALVRFADEEFDDAQLTTYTNAVLGSASAASAAFSLGEGVSALESALRAEVVSHHPELLAAATGLRDVSGSLSALRSGVEVLHAAAGRVRAEVAEPHRQIAVRTRQLAALSSTVELLHAVTRALQLGGRLRESLAPGGELSRAAKTLADLQLLHAEYDLSDVAVLQAELAFVSQARSRILSSANAQLEASLEALSQSDTGAALQVLFNAGDALHSSCERCVAVAAKKAGAAFVEAFDPRDKSALTAGSQAQRAASVAAVWARLEAATDTLCSCALRVWQCVVLREPGTRASLTFPLLLPADARPRSLSRLLSKKRDPSTHARLADALPASFSPLESFWGPTLKVMGEACARSAAGGGAAREALTASYPRLLALLMRVPSKLAAEADAREKGAPPVIRRGDAARIAAVVDPFRAAFLTRSATRAAEAAAEGVWGDASPTAADGARFASAVRLFVGNPPA